MPAQSKQHFTFSSDASYLSRDNIIVPERTLVRTAALVATNAVAELAARFSSTVDTNVAVTGEDTPASDLAA